MMLKGDRSMSSIASSATVQVQPIRFWQHGRAVRQMLRAYPPGTDALVDSIRSSSGALKSFALQWLLLPLYFAREQGWTVRDQHHMAAIMYLRRNIRQGIRVLHVDDINVDAAYRRRGFAQRLMALAEELASQEQRPFLKLAVTVANTPAVTLYRRLGYQDQHHRYFTCLPTGAASPGGGSSLRLRPLRRRAAWAANRRFYLIELQASVPAVAEMLVAFYPRGAGNVGVPKVGELRYAVEHGGEQIGYSDAYRRHGQWQLRVSLRPEMWGTTVEQELIQRLLGAVASAHSGPDRAEPVALHVPSSSHFEALGIGVARAHSVASALGLREQSHDRMIMVKVVASES
jgi:GNAT superfamily N-acetyltransferase